MVLCYLQLPTCVKLHKIALSTYCWIKLIWFYLQKSGGTMPNTLVLSHSSRAMAMVNQPVLSQELELFLKDTTRSSFLVNPYSCSVIKSTSPDVTFREIIAMKRNSRFDLINHLFRDTDEDRLKRASFYALYTTLKEISMRNTIILRLKAEVILHSKETSSYLPVGLLFTCKWVYEWLDWRMSLSFCLLFCKLVFSQPFFCRYLIWKCYCKPVPFIFMLMRFVPFFPTLMTEISSENVKRKSHSTSLNRRTVSAVCYYTFIMYY